ncbi:MAG: hypothetical protein EXQ70_07505 [Solirubrobacterales bacterium]|nr:hypothetical protein [Solirubrobacterales bacterium]
MDTITEHRTVIRFGLVYLAVTIGIVALWILLAPREFYDDFPTGPAAWVSALPPYNEHLERDFGAYGLGLAVLAGLAAWWMERRVVQAAAITIFVAGVPHLIYHLTTTGQYSTSDNVASIGGLALQPLFALGILYLARAPRKAAARPLPERG